MRTLTLILFTLICQLSVAQNAFFIPFGQSINEVENLLYEREYYKNNYEKLENQIISELFGNQQVTYNFKDKVLFGVEDQRLFSSKKHANKAIESCMKFLHSKEGKVISMNSQDTRSHHVTVTEDEILELIVKKGKKEKEVIVILKSTSRFHGPRMETEAFIAGLN